MKPVVSVIVASYRREDFLKRAMESLANQTMRNFEIILVDDNDDPFWNAKIERVVYEFKNEHSEIPLTYIQNHPNIGSAESRNAGARVAVGNYITFLDDDDIYLPDKIKNQYEFMVSKKLDFSVTELALYYDDDTFFEYRKRDYIKNYDSRSLLQYHMMYHMTGTDTMMFYKPYFDCIGGFAPIDVGDEFYLMERAICGEGHFGCLHRCDVKAYVHKGECGLSSGQGKIDGENSLYVHKKKFFADLDKKSVRYIKMRHHAVLAFAYLRSKRKARFLKEAIIAFGVAPIGCLKMLLNIVR